MSFFYTVNGDAMKLYLDVIFFLNFAFDFILLMATSMILRRNVKIRRLLLGGLVGGMSIFILFLKINSFELFLLKIIISLVMVLTTFNFKDVRYTLKNLYYLYTVSIILGGFLYFLNVQFSYKQEGLVFYHNGLSINFIVLIISSPIIIYTYVKQLLNFKNNYSNYYKVDIYLKDGTIKKFNAFLDTGNKLYDPYKKRPIIIIYEKDLKVNIDMENMLMVPYDGVNSHGILKCIIPEKIYIFGVGVKKDVLIGISKEKIDIDGVNCILHTKLLEG